MLVGVLGDDGCEPDRLASSSACLISIRASISNGDSSRDDSLFTDDMRLSRCGQLVDVGRFVAGENVTGDVLRPVSRRAVEADAAVCRRGLLTS